MTVRPAKTQISLGIRSAWASAQSDQSLRCALCGQLRTQGFFTLIRLGECPGWSESWLGAHSFAGFVMSRLIYLSENESPSKIEKEVSSFAMMRMRYCLWFYSGRPYERDSNDEIHSREYAKCFFFFFFFYANKPPHDKTHKMACAPSEDSDQPAHPPSLIRVFAVRMKKAWVLNYPLSAQRRL